jgi:hypothetical protein
MSNSTVWNITYFKPGISDTGFGHPKMRVEVSNGDNSPLTMDEAICIAKRFHGDPESCVWVAQAKK